MKASEVWFTIVLFLCVSPTVSSLASSVPQQSMLDVTYCTVDGVDLKMDIYYPDNVTEVMNPLVVYVHGGAWVKGDKRSGAGSLEMPKLLARGYVVASLDYRLAPQFKFPAQIEDVKCAIRSLRANAAIYRIDPNRIGAWGGSAGGHLVSLLGVTDTGAGFDVGQYVQQSSRVTSIVDYFGPSDLTAPDFAGKRNLMSVFGTPDMLKLASPVEYVSSDDPPFLIVHGERDDVVPLSQSRELYARLTGAHVSATLTIVKNAGHGFKPSGGPINPTRAEIIQTTADFFDSHLKGTQTTTAQTSSSLVTPPEAVARPWFVIAVLVLTATMAGVAVFWTLKRRDT